MAVVRKKQDDKYLLALRELVTSGAGNRQCFDCGQKGPTYVNMTIGSFVCTRCSGVLRGLTPPHRVKSISMATFTQEEIDFLRAHGNELCAKTWLGLWDPKRAAHQQQQDQRELMTDKYERKRYYLEPASPLKSLNLKAAAPANLQSHSHNGQHHGHNGVSVSTLSSNGYASIHLTPPAAQRTTANGLHKGTSVSSSSSATSTSINRPQHHHHNHSSNNNNNNNNDAFGMNGRGGLTSLNSAGSTSTGALSDTSSCASNGFAGESDFVADFGTANIFDATSARSAGSPAVSSASSVSSTNGYAKVQPIRAAHLHQQQQQQHQLLNDSQGAENFADFDHAPIFNGVASRAAKALAPVFNGWVSDWSRNDFHDPFDDSNWLPPKPQPQPPAAVAPAAAAPTAAAEIAKRVRDGPALNWSFWQEQMQMEPEPEMEYSMIQRTSSTNSWHSSGEEPPLSPSNPFLSYLTESPESLAPPSRGSYLLFSSLSSSFPEEEEYEYLADEPAAAAASESQQSQDSDILNANFSDLFAWSAPLQNGHTPAGHKSSAPAVAPSEDRYAALKDLDEQLRELKASESSASEAPTPTNGNNNNGHQATDAFGSALINNNPNPFKSQQQQQQQMLSSHVVNPFQQQQQNQHQQQNLYGQLTLIPNAYGSSPQQSSHLHQQQQQQHQQTSFFNFNNNGYAMAQGLPNGCGFGSMQPAPVMANNPFAASGAMNTNNPFL